MPGYFVNAQVSLKKVNGKWKGVILLILLKKDYRFNKIKQIIGRISAKVLTDNLDLLEADGLIKKYENVYSLTIRGRRIAHLTLSIIDNLKLYILPLMCKTGIGIAPYFYYSTDISFI